MPKLETITNSLATGYKRLEPASFQTSAELTTERRTNDEWGELAETCFYTANFTVCTLENGEEVLYFGGREANPILRNIDEACRQLIENGNYRINNTEKEAIEEAVNRGLVLRLKMAELGLKELTDGFINDKYNYFEIETENYDALNLFQRAFAEAVYDKGQDFIENMEIFSKAGIKATKIYVLNPKYVRKEAKNGPIARAGFLYIFDCNSDFIALDRDVYDNDGLCGVSRSSLEVAAGDETQNLVSLPEDALHQLLNQYFAGNLLTELKSKISDLYQ